jgi:hypothetical protein
MAAMTARIAVTSTDQIDTDSFVKRMADSGIRSHSHSQTREYAVFCADGWLATQTPAREHYSWMKYEPRHSPDRK